MATFVKGNFVQVTPKVDWKWDQWSAKHTDLCGKTCTVTDTKYEQWVNQLYIEVDYRGKRLWFLDSHLIIVEDYDEIYFESIHKACEELQKHEKICKKLRDDILRGVFGEEEDVSNLSTEEVDEFFEDWQEVTTKEVIPLPGNGGTMTNPDADDPKAKANSHRKKVRKIKGLGTKKKITKKSSSKKLTDSWTLSDDEIKELEDYLDALPYSNPPNQAGDYDYEYDTGEDDDTGWFT